MHYLLRFFFFFKPLIVELPRHVGRIKSRFNKRRLFLCFREREQERKKNTHIHRHTNDFFVNDKTRLSYTHSCIQPRSAYFHQHRARVKLTLSFFLFIFFTVYSRFFFFTHTHTRLFIEQFQIHLSVGFKAEASGPSLYPRTQTICGDI